MEYPYPGRFPRLRRWLVLSLWWLSIWGVIGVSGALTLLEAQGLHTEISPGQTDNVVRCTVHIDRAPNAVSALGFEVVYDPMIWRYSGHFVAGELASRLNFFNAHEATPGRIRIGGGAMSSRLEPGSSGALLTMDFQVLQPGTANLHFENLVDHVAGWSTRVEHPGKPPAAINSSRP